MASTAPLRDDQSLTVMIIEDEMIFALDLESWLRSPYQNCATSLASSGTEALAIAAIVLPDIAFVDINLGGNRDGIETARELHSRYGISIVFVTGEELSDVRSRTKDLPDAGVLTKPVDKVDLARYLDDARHRLQTTRLASHPSGGFAKIPLSIALLGSYPVQVHEHLTQRGHTVSAVQEGGGGSAGFDLAGADVLFISLPPENLRQSLAQLRRVHQHHPGVPVLVSSAGPALPLSQASLCGIDSYLRTPVDLNELDLALHRLADRQVADSLEDASGLFGRVGFRALARQQLNAARRTGTHLALLRADLSDADDLTSIESTFSRLGPIVRSTFRDADIAGRLDGSDCGVLLLNASEQTTPIAMARFRESIAALQAQVGSLGLQLGLGHFDPGAPCSLEQLVARSVAQTEERF